MGSESVSDLSFCLEIHRGSEVQGTQKVQSAQKFGFRSFGIYSRDSHLYLGCRKLKGTKQERLGTLTLLSLKL